MPERCLKDSYLFAPVYRIMDIYKYDVYRGPNIGIYAAANDSVVFLPAGYTKARGERLGECLGAEVAYISVAGTRLIGALMVFNNHGLLLPATATEQELEQLREFTDLNVEVFDSKYTALGNLICANDRGAIVSSEISKLALRKISDVLNVEVIRGKVAGYHQVGAMTRANMQGGIVHPEASEDEICKLSEVLGVEMEPATVNGGVPFISSGVLLNSRALVTGSFTNGPEIMMLTRAFGG